MEDEEEVEREKRRRERGISTAEADSRVSPTPSEVVTKDEVPGGAAIGDEATTDEALRDGPAPTKEDPADTTDSGPPVFQPTSR